MKEKLEIDFGSSTARKWKHCIDHRSSLFAYYLVLPIGSLWRNPAHIGLARLNFKVLVVECMRLPSASNQSSPCPQNIDMHKIKDTLRLP